MVRDLLLIALAVGILAAGAFVEAPERAKPGADAEQLASVSAASVFALSNGERKDNGVAQLSLNPLLMRAAQLKAEDMAKEAYYAHVSPDGETPMHFLDAVGYKYQYVGENLTANILNEKDVVSAWMGSAGHRRNLLDPKFEHMGIGVAEGTYKGKPALFVVQMLATPKPVQLPAKPAPAPTVPKPKAPIPPPAPKKVIATAKPPAEPLTESKVVEEVKELAKPIVDPLLSTSTVRSLFATATDPIPLVISTSAIPVELRATATPEIPVQSSSQARAAGREVSVRWHTKVADFFRDLTQSVTGLFSS